MPFGLPVVPDEYMIEVRAVLIRLHTTGKRIFRQEDHSTVNPSLFRIAETNFVD